MYFPRDGPVPGSDGEGLLGTPFDTAVLDPDPDTNTLHVTSATGLFQVSSIVPVAAPARHVKHQCY